MKAGRSCPVPGCGNLLPWPKAATCAACWRRVPEDFRRRIKQARAQQAWHVVGQVTIDALRWLTEHPRNAGVDRVLGEAPT